MNWSKLKAITLAVGFRYLLQIWILFLSSSVLQGQVVLDWSAQLGGNGTDLGSAITIDSEGNVIGTGKFSNLGDFDPDPINTETLTANVQSPYLVKLNTNGELIWAVSFSAGVAHAVYTDSSDAIYVTGECYTSSDFDPGPDTFILPAPGAEAAFLAKFDSDGNFLWAKSFGGASCIPSAMEIDDANNVYISGTFSGSGVDFSFGGPSVTMTSSGLRGFVVKVDSDGNLIWNHVIGGFQTWCYDIALDENANVYLTGLLNGTADMDVGPSVHNVSANDDAFVLKMDSSASFIWLTHFNDYCCSNMSGDALDVDQDGNVILIGAWNATNDFDNGPGVFLMEAEGTLIYSYDAYIVKLDSNGDFVWAGSMGNEVEDEARDVKVDTAGNIYTMIYTGTWSVDYADADPGPDTFQMQYPAKYLVQKIDPSGDLIWARNFPLEGGNEIALDENGSLFATGIFEGEEVNFALSLPGYSLETSFNGGYSADIYIMKLDQCSNMTYGTTDIEVCDMYVTLDSVDVYTTSGVYTEQLLNAQGCDSILTINLTVKESSYLFSNVTSCGPYTSSLTGTVFSAPGNYYDIGVNAVGCDSVNQFNLAILPLFYTSMYVNACDSFTVPSGNSTYFLSGFYYDTLVAGNGCDSILSIQLNLYDESNPVLYLNGVLWSTLLGCDSYQWIDCSNNSIIAGATFSYYTPIANGNYSLISSMDGCIDTSSCILVQNAGISNSEVQKIFIGPNPASDKINLFGFDQLKNIISIQISSLSGEIIFIADLTSTTIDISTLAAGEYVLTIIDQNDVVIQKFVKL